MLWVAVLVMVVIPATLLVIGITVIATARGDVLRVLLGITITAIPLLAWGLALTPQGWEGAPLVVGAGALLTIALLLGMAIVLREIVSLLRDRRSDRAHR